MRAGTFVGQSLSGATGYHRPAMAEQLSFLARVAALPPARATSSPCGRRPTPSPSTPPTGCSSRPGAGIGRSRSSSPAGVARRGPGPRRRPAGRGPRGGAAGARGARGAGRGRVRGARRRAGRGRRQRPRRRPGAARAPRGQPGRPVAFLAFDLLHLDGNGCSAPLERRRAALRRCCGRATRSCWSRRSPARAGRSTRRSRNRASPGVMARQRTSPYLPGVRSKLWRSILAGPAGRGRRRHRSRRSPTGTAPGPRAVPPAPVRRRTGRAVATRRGSAERQTFIQRDLAGAERQPISPAVRSSCSRSRSGGVQPGGYASRAETGTAERAGVSARSWRAAGA